MKTTVLVVLLFSSCFASSLYQEWSAKANSKRADQATITCQTVNNQCVNLGGSCSAGCPDCVAAFTSCEASASTNEALCTCANTFINCYAAAKDPSCNSDFYHDQCLAQISNCTCGTPYTGALTAKSCYSNAYCTDAGTCVSVKGVGSACNYSSECGDVNADPSWSYDYTCENNVCQKSVKNLPGDSCSSNSDCEFYADFSLGCSSGKCASQQVGSVCPMSDNNVYCGPNLYCDDQDTCRKTIAFGSTCDGNATESARTSMCGNLGACDSDSNTCVRYLSKTKGQSCTFEGECGDGLYCSKNTSTCQSNLPQIACNSDDDCTKANPDYTGCDCFGGKPMCSAPTSACNSEALALYTCIEDNNCPTDFIPGGCVQNNCKKEHDCYFACYSNYIAQAYGGSGDSCLSNYVNTCDAPSFAAKNSVAWAVVASASAAAILL